ncbi:hypothetical protein [Streptomyces sp. MN13]
MGNGGTLVERIPISADRLWEDRRFDEAREAAHPSGLLLVFGTCNAAAAASAIV